MQDKSCSDVEGQTARLRRAPRPAQGGKALHALAGLVEEACSVSDSDSLDQQSQV